MESLNLESLNQCFSGCFLCLFYYSTKGKGYLHKMDKIVQTIVLDNSRQVPSTKITIKMNFKKAVVKAPNLLADVELNPNKIATS